MRASLPSVLWRVLLAISLIASPVAPVAAGAHAEDAAALAAAEEAMPCHGDAAPMPAPADHDGGCCPPSDCDFGVCRVAGPLVEVFVPTLAGVPAVPVIAPASPAPPDSAAPPLLRPPIA